MCTVEQQKQHRNIDQGIKLITLVKTETRIWFLIMEFISTEKGGRMLIRDNYQYVFQKNLANGVTSWECVMRRRGECKARVKLSPADIFIEQINDHTHASSQTRCEVSKISAAVKRKATTTLDTSQQILATAMENISPAVAVNLPSINTIRRNIRAARQERDLPVNPQDRQAIPAVLPLNYQTTSTGEQFLIHDSGDNDPDRMIIFGSEQAVHLRANSEHWYGDATFKVCPEIFFQLYTLHAQHDGRIFPCIFALLPNKTQATYNRFFREVFGHILAYGNGPDDILIDFERSVINAISIQNPNIDIKGCFYHLCSNIWKHIQNFGLQERYKGDAEFALQIRMIAALAFLPPADVVPAFENLCDDIRHNYGVQADEILLYFEDNYIGRFMRNAPRQNPLFAIDLWNMFHRTDQELPRTNNSVEGWHRAFQSNLTECHPTFWKFLAVLKREEGIVRVSILQHLGGHHPPPQRRRYLDCNARIVRIIDDLRNRETLQYLRSIAHNLSF